MRADREQVRCWLAAVRSAAPGLLNVVSTANWAGRCFTDVEPAVDYVMRLDQAGPQGIYLRVSTLRREPEEGRGGTADTMALYGWWSDIDYGQVGHKPSKQPDALLLPPDAESARRIVEKSGLPEPTLVTNSGGGLYAWWMFTQAHVIDGDLDQVEALSARWQDVLGSAARKLGRSYGVGVKDLARVLRIPGTVNRKADFERPCRIVEASGVLYSYDELSRVAESIPVDKPAPASPGRPASCPRSTAPGDGPFDALAATVTFADLLEPAGWTHVGRDSAGELWRRPGNPESAYSARAYVGGLPVLVVHSESAGLPSGAGQRLTVGRVFAHLHHRGDERAAAQDLLLAAAGNPAASPGARALPAPVLAAIAARCRVTPWRAAPAPSTPARTAGASGRNITRRISGLLNTVISAEQDSRHSCLSWAARRMNESVIDGVIDATQARNLLLAAAERTGLTRAEAERTIGSAFNTAGRA